MEWISVKDRLPKRYTQVLVYRPNAHVDGDEITTIKMHITEGVFDGAHEVTHWMELPPKP